MPLDLVLPSEEYKSSYIEAIEEFPDEHLRVFEYASLSEMRADFPLYVQKLRSYAKGEGLPEGYLPHTEYWLIENGEYIGRLDIRHSLNEHLLDVGGHIGYDIRPTLRKKGYGTKILELGLVKAKEIGLEKVLLTNLFQNKTVQFFLAIFSGLFITRLIALAFFAISINYPEVNQQVVNDSFHHYHLGLLLILSALLFKKVKKSYLLLGFGLGVLLEELAVVLDDVGFEGYRFFYLNGIDFILILSALIITSVLATLWLKNRSHISSLTLF